MAVESATVNAKVNWSCIWGSLASPPGERRAGRAVSNAHCDQVGTETLVGLVATPVGNMPIKLHFCKAHAADLILYSDCVVGDSAPKSAGCVCEGPVCEIHGEPSQKPEAECSVCKQGAGNDCEHFTAETSLIRAASDPGPKPGQTPE